MVWTHSLGTTPRGVLVAIVHGASSTDYVSGVDYGGVALARAQRDVDTATEAGAAEIWFAGAGLPANTRDVTVTLTASTTDDLHGTSFALSGSGDLEVIAQGGVDNNAANPGVALAYGARTAMAFAAFYSGLTDMTTVLAGPGAVKVTSLDLAGNFANVVLREVTAASSGFTISASAATDDVAFAAVAVSEVQPSTGSIFPWITLRGNAVADAAHGVA